ncbi:hypothetical protein [Filomicrobium sp.]|uniref:hypothetical protein n=1 Tax=Filomicrobium sp. TaxID=2024831 RepID=UPI0025864B62|nr:hypothetical protein [Filomicrobium sp.]MCV0369532.1 hypothetical protein [Filomicrobium sp.]
MTMTLSTEDTLGAILDDWTKLTLEARAAEHDWLRKLGVSLPREVDDNDRKLTMDMARDAEPHLAAFLRDNSDKTPLELEELAVKLSPGGAHDGGLLVRLIRANMWDADPLLLAAIIRWNWHGGKRGFQFLSDPAETDLYDYEEEATSLMELFDEALDGDPHRILTGEDRAFFDSLPDRFTAYRGCAGVPVEHAATGVCWTTRRAVAEWFALRTADFMKAEPILLSARIAKTEVRIAKASEFEVVAIPSRSRVLKCRRRLYPSWQPEMEWQPVNGQKDQFSGAA